MSGPAPTLSHHQHLVDLWRGRLVEARKKYDQVIVELQATRNFTSETLPTPTPDGSTKRILRAETQALDEYMRTLRIFTELVISGKAPEEQQAKEEKDGDHSAGR